MKQYGKTFPSACLVFLFPFFSYSQTTHDTLTFVRFNSYIGYVIDSVENSKCHCVPFAGENFSYGSLIQLPSSIIVMRMKISNCENFINVPMNPKDVSQLSAAAARIQVSFSDEKTEESLLKKLAGNVAVYKFTDYSGTILRTRAIANSSASSLAVETDFHPFFNLGLGISCRDADHGFFVPNAELGGIYKKHVLTLRVLKNKEPRPIFDNINPIIDFYETSLLYGRTVDGGRVGYAFSTGIGYVWGILRGELLSRQNYFLGTNSTYQEISLSTLGIPLEAKMMIGGIRKFNADLIAFANINTKYPYFGVLICLRIGAIKNSKVRKK